jgi:Zn-dependent oligopeptidase
MEQDLKNHKEMIDIILRQTDYNYEEAELKLKLHDNNLMNVIRENINMGKNKVEPEKKIKSLQQAIYTEIRTFMDDVYKNKKTNAQ